MENQSQQPKIPSKRRRFALSLRPEELARELQEYSSKSAWKQPRGYATILILIVAIINLVLVLVGWTSPLTLVDVVLLLVLSYFVFRGYIWAIVIAMALWLVEKGYGIVAVIISGQSIVASGIYWNLFWLWLGAQFFWPAYQIERARAIKSSKRKIEQPPQ